ncbi:hypothetical protein KEM54_000883 [Ascosphaera aggregata]|nr:hypothetical protein KEM54_000883 [Ascosphaera aggregata]
MTVETSNIPGKKEKEDDHHSSSDSGDDGSSSSTSSDVLNLARDDEWEDLEPDVESQPVVDLFSAEVYPDARTMLAACKEKTGFDFVKIKRDLNLDFLDTVKLVNYIRSEVKAGNANIDVSAASVFADDKYLMPVLEDDALLYNLEDISDEEEQQQEQQQQQQPNSDARRIQELEEEVCRVRGDFAEYKLMVKKAFDQELEKSSETVRPAEKPESSRYQEEESGYFKSYSYNSIHETMLKDSIRTDSYRDFVYDNKSLFKDKVVLDVGCGTGILSMFCAKAGAKLVIAVDNSDIIDRARENVFDNGFGDVIKCLRGKIEEVELPVPRVDIIISEWMGYALLFEAMFDSVIYARDRYLVPGGLMVPSHATLQIAPVADSELVDSHISFWNEVYGFKMRSMLLGIYDEALVRTIPASSLAGKACPFLQLPLHTATVEDLTFIKDFKVTLESDIDALDGFAIWFDIFFMPSSKDVVPLEATPEKMRKEDFVAFTTGPHGKETHWQQTICLINRSKALGKPLAKQSVIDGQVQYSKKDEKSRLLDIGITWDAGESEKGGQKWSIQ